MTPKLNIALFKRHNQRKSSDLLEALEARDLRMYVCAVNISLLVDVHAPFSLISHYHHLRPSLTLPNSSPRQSELRLENLRHPLQMKSRSQLLVKHIPNSWFGGLRLISHHCWNIILVTSLKRNRPEGWRNTIRMQSRQVPAGPRMSWRWSRGGGLRSSQRKWRLVRDT